MPSRNRSTFRFYEELNDFLPPLRRKTAFDYEFDGTPSVKDSIEAVGVPHTEVDLILVDGESVDFRHLLRGGERVAVYPLFERLDIAGLTRLRPAPLRDPRFVLDVHLGRLARYLRLAGFDTCYANDYDDATVVSVSLAERRIILTRDVGILKHRAVTHGYWVRNSAPRAQLREVVAALDLATRVRPFERCMQCNGTLRDASREEVIDRVPPSIAREHDRFRLCESCGRIYWRGSHYDRLVRLLDEALIGLRAPLS
ncbi:MAG TPA: Mut7-C RNAse domain-containing protein [Steroidobacteraceae bacterium]|nr:Mut7-C RNAse domain-containing protein [Steroidobacteraceae bacterium]